MVAKARFVGDRIAPFGPFRRGQRQVVVEHGVEHVDERHVGDDAGEQVGRHVGDRAHQHAAGRAAMGDDAAARACSLLATRCSPAAMKSVKVFGLLLALAVRVPALALVRAAAHMGDGVDEAAVDQRQAVGRERCRHGDAVGAVAVEQQGAEPSSGVSLR